MLDEHQEVVPAEKMVAFAFAFAAWSIEDCLDMPKEVMINVRSRNKRLGKENVLSPIPDETGGVLSLDTPELESHCLVLFVAYTSELDQSSSSHTCHSSIP